MSMSMSMSLQATAIAPADSVTYSGTRRMSGGLVLPPEKARMYDVCLSRKINLMHRMVHTAICMQQQRLKRKRRDQLTDPIKG